jgi:hypothetical protein
MESHEKLVELLDKICKWDYITKPRVDYVKIIFTDRDDFITTRDTFREQNVEFYTFPEYSKKPQRFVIRGLPVNTSATAVAKDLQNKGYSVQNVTQLGKTYRDEENPLANPTVEKWPLFIVTVCAIPGNPYIDPTCIRTVLHCNIKIETPRAPKVLPMCFNCQLAGHKATFCNQKPRCVVCAGPHASQQCPNKSKPPKCANCRGTHPASYRGCPYHVKIAERYLQQNPPEITEQDEETNEEHRDQIQEETTQERIWRRPTTNKTSKEDFPPMKSNNTPSDPPNRQQAPPPLTTTTSQEEIPEEDQQNQPGSSNKKTFAETLIHNKSRQNPNQKKPTIQKANITPTNQPVFANTQQTTTQQDPNPSQSLNNNTNPNNHQQMNSNIINNQANSNPIRTQEQRQSTQEEPWWMKIVITLSDMLISLNLHPILNMIASTVKDLTTAFNQFQHGA